METEAKARECESTEHFYLPLDMTARNAMGQFPKYILFCQKCGKKKNIE